MTRVQNSAGHMVCEKARSPDEVSCITGFLRKSWMFGPKRNQRFLNPGHHDRLDGEYGHPTCHYTSSLRGVIDYVCGEVGIALHKAEKASFVAPSPGTP